MRRPDHRQVLASAGKVRSRCHTAAFVAAPTPWPGWPTAWPICCHLVRLGWVATRRCRWRSAWTPWPRWCWTGCRTGGPVAWSASPRPRSATAWTCCWGPLAALGFCQPDGSFLTTLYQLGEWLAEMARSGEAVLVDGLGTRVQRPAGVLAIDFCSNSAVRLLRLPLPTRRDCPGRALVSALRPVLPRCRGTAGRARCRGRPRDRLPVGAALHTAPGRCRPAMQTPGGRSLAGGRDLREGRWTVVVCLPRDRPVRPDHRRVRRPTARRRRCRLVLPAGHRLYKGSASRGHH
jgi:hypothetical protein